MIDGDSHYQSLLDTEKVQHKGSKKLSLCYKIHNYYLSHVQPNHNPLFRDPTDGHDTNIADDAARTVSFDFSKLPEGADVEKYVLKCTWANNDNDDAKVVTYNGTDYILQEPTLNGEYTFKFVKQETLDAIPLELSTDNGAALSSHDVDAIYKDNKLEVSLKDVVPDILSDFGIADKKDVRDFYMRWVLADKDGKILSVNSSNSALALRNTSDGTGYYTLLSTEGSSLLPTGLNVTFGLPSGSFVMTPYCAS